MITRKIKSTAKVKKLELTAHTDNQDATQYISDANKGKMMMWGREPVVWYNGIHIPTSSIEALQVKSDSFLPQLQLWFTDFTGLMQNSAFAVDNTVISVYIDPRTKESGGTSLLTPVRMDFKITDYAFLEESNMFYIQGVVDMDYLYVNEIKSYPDLTSFSVMENICRASGLGFYSNMTATADKMTWISPNTEPYKFIKDVTAKGYRTDRSYLTSFIDLYYNLCYIDVDLQSEDEVLTDAAITLDDTGINQGDNIAVQPLYLVSKDMYDTNSNNRYNHYEVMNRSSKVSLENGYRTDLFYYDKTAGWDNRAGGFMKFNIETNTDKEGIPLKGVPSDTKGFFKNNSKSLYLPPIDIRNTHANYRYAEVSNSLNKDEYNKLLIKVVMVHPNFNIHRYQKLMLVIHDISNGSETVINEKLSGGWIVKDMYYNYTAEDGFTQELVMTRRSLNN